VQAGGVQPLAAELAGVVEVGERGDDQVAALDLRDQAVGTVRAGGIISRVGVPQYEEAPIGFGSLFGRSIGLAGGPGAQRAYIEELLPDVLEGRLDPGGS
jgi:threonine dehydrogenase-like Zn-dependent dehydrogenase